MVRTHKYTQQTITDTFVWGHFSLKLIQTKSVRGRRVHLNTLYVACRTTTIVTTVTAYLYSLHQ